MEGQHGRILCFAVGSMYPNKSPTMCSSDFVFRKYKQDSAYHVSGVLHLAKTGPLITKNFPLLRLFSSDAYDGLKAKVRNDHRSKFSNLSNWKEA